MGLRKVHLPLCQIIFRQTLFLCLALTPKSRPSKHHCFVIATMTRRRRAATKRKERTSGSSPDLPASKRQQGEDEEQTMAQFTTCFLDSLNDPEVRDTYLSIVDEGIAKHISKLEARAAEDEKRISNLEAELQKVNDEKNATEMELQDLLQYTRRNALRISNPAWIEPVNSREPEDTDALVLGLAVSLRVPLEPWEIGRSHRVGKKRPGGAPRPVLVKFISYNIRHRFFEARKKLKNHSTLRKVYINEDLTRQNNRLAYEARQLRKQGAITDTFTRDGHIYVKRHPADKAVVVRDLNHLQTVARPPTPRHVPRGSPGVTPAPADRNETNDDTTVSMSLLQPRPPAIPGHTMNSESAPALTSTPRRSHPHPVIRESALPSSPCPGAEGDSAEGIDNSQPSQTSDSMDTEYY